MAYIAMGTLSAPGTIVAGYRRGDEVPDSVVENWDLVVGEDVAEGELSVDGPPPMARPGVEDNRATWERWAVANGMSEEDAAAASQDDLEATGPEEGVSGDSGDPVRPADSAKKAEWVAYVQRRTDDEATKAWATADSTTKADLQAWDGHPVPSDTVAASATEANLGS